MGKALEVNENTEHAEKRKPAQEKAKVRDEKPVQGKALRVNENTVTSRKPAD